MLHPQCRALLDLIDKRGVPALHTLSPADARAAYRERRFFTQPEPPAVAEVRDLQAPTPQGPLPLRLYRPTVQANAMPLPVLIYYHGGGWVIGDLDTHDTLCRELANQAGCAVVAVDYRMGPEHRFPAAVDDALAALQWVRASSTTLGLDAKRIAVGGDSAGGNLAAVVALHDKASAALPLALQLLIYPATDMSRTAASHVTNGQGYLLTKDTIDYFVGHYIDDASHHDDWRASPLRHTNLAGAAPALVLTAGYDPLRDEGLAYAQALTEAGVRTTHICFERQIHGFILMGKVLDEANTAVMVCAAELRRAFAA
jgi:acetyl esterase